MLTVQNLPTVSTPGNAAASGYQCVFTGHGTTLHTSVTRIDRIDAANTTLHCETPPAKHLPLFPAGKGIRKYLRYVYLLVVMLIAAIIFFIVVVVTIHRYSVIYIYIKLARLSVNIASLRLSFLKCFYKFRHSGCSINVHVFPLNSPTGSGSESLWSKP